VRIALDATPLTLSSGGLPRYVSELGLALAREFPGDEYVFLSDQPFSMPSDSPPNLTRGRGIETPAGKHWWLWGLRGAIRHAGADIFHGTNFEVPYLGGVPSVLTIHDLSPWRDRAWHNAADRVRQRTPWLLKFRRACAILTVSEAVRREVISYFGVNAGMVHAAPLAASPRFHPMSPGPGGVRPFFLFVGTLEPRKNIPALIEAWRATRDETGAELVIAGRSRSDFPPLQSEDGLIILGEVADDELPRLYSEALAFVYPTHYEGFGLPVLEAMQCGCPVITSADPAVMELSGGAAIHAASVAEIAESMRAIASRPEVRRSLRAAGLRRSALYSWARTARLTRAVYARAPGEKS
jgi:glycosyltransferase involved in cell wall biosynthesis